MALRIRQVERACACRNGAHKALPQTKLGKVDSLGIKTFGGVKFKNAVCAQYIEGADFRDHVLRNFADDPVKARLWFQRLRHQFTQSLEQYTGTGCQLTHFLGGSSLCATASPSLFLSPVSKALRYSLCEQFRHARPEQITPTRKILQYRAPSAARGPVWNHD